LRNHLQVEFHGRIKIDSILARRSHDKLLHVTVRRMQQSTAFRSCKNGNRVGSAGCTQIRSFERINGDVNFRQGEAFVDVCTYLFADIQHRCLVAFTFANDDRSAHGNGIHGAAHGFGSYLISPFAVTHAHRLGRFNGRFFHDASELERQFKLHVLREPVQRLDGLSLRHGSPSEERSGHAPKREEAKGGPAAKLAIITSAWPHYSSKSSST